MINAYDIAYGLGVGAAAPFWLSKPAARRKVLRAFAQRMGHVARRDSAAPAILIHAVSLGEINATPALVKLLQQARPDLHVIVSTTTETGYDRGRQLYGSTANVSLVRFPLDFTAAVVRLLDALRPSLVVLMELELWPNFLRQCHKRRIPVVLVNGRMTPPAFHRYKRVKPIAAAMLRRLSAICVQEEAYAQRFIQLGAPSANVQVTGTMKFDTAQVSDRVAGDEQLAGEVGLVEQRAVGSGQQAENSSLPAAHCPLPASPRIWVCGSTGPGEEQIILDAYRALIGPFPNLRLVIVPRHPQRFDEVAALIQQAGFPLRRRSIPAEPLRDERAVILGDTMGELRKFYSLAEVVFVGRTLVDLGPRQHGSDMIEPAALAKPIVIGPWTHNFAEAMQQFRQADALREVSDESALVHAITDWLTNPPEAAALGQRAQTVVRQNQGATARHAEIILSRVSVVNRLPIT
jgi:3-deoxy-D-manno-octulosonic-acid transferase